jgi:hypothetical protein
LITGLIWGLAAGYMAARKGTSESPEQIQPQIQAKVIGVLLCDPSGHCLSMPLPETRNPQEMEEFGEIPFCDELPGLILPPDPVPQNFPSPHGSEPSAFDPTGIEL